MFSWQDSPLCKTHKGRKKTAILKRSWQSFLTIFCFREAANTFYSRVFPFIKCSSVIGWKCKKCKSSRNWACLGTLIAEIIINGRLNRLHKKGFEFVGHMNMFFKAYSCTLLIHTSISKDTCKILWGCSIHWGGRKKNRSFCAVNCWHGVTPKQVTVSATNSSQ